MGRVTPSATCLVTELADRVPAPFLSAAPFGRLSAPGLPALAQQGPVGDAFLAFIGVPPGSAAPVRERDAGGAGGGFAALEAFCRRVVGVSRLYWCNSPPYGGALDVVRARPWASHGAIPPFAGGEAAVRGGVAPKVQTTSAKYADNGLSWARWSALWAQRRLPTVPPVVRGAG